MVLTVKDMTFEPGKELKICGKPKSGCSVFSINIGHDCDTIALHFNPRFDHGSDHHIIVCNSLRDGWGDEQREPLFPFNEDEEFKLVINFNNEHFYIKLPDGNMISFPNRFGDDKFNHIHVQGDVKIYSIKIK
ncbi:lectin, galactoside-binding, soluble, 2b [Chanos chanos]|uniref:Galectin n=1 Tax=Chanos chanos TaxID=29144 RepID=A0A6J2VZM8_CHACN|nr:beta-galactoside-binding lectin-like [Chanos chanos]